MRALRQSDTLIAFAWRSTHLARCCGLLLSWHRIHRLDESTLNRWKDDTEAACGRSVGISRLSCSSSAKARNGSCWTFQHPLAAEREERRR